MTSRAHLNADVTVVLACYNEVDFLEESVRSITEQTILPKRLILIDDASEECQCRSIADAWDHPSIELEYVAVPHGGQAAAFNLGVGMVDTEFLAFQDADDIWMPDKLERQLDFLSEHPTFDSVGGGVTNFRLDDTGQVSEERYFSQSRQLQSTLFRTERFRAVGPISVDVIAHNAVEWWSRSASFGFTTGYVDGEVLRRRIHHRNMSVLLAEEKRAILLAQVRTHIRRSGS